jgi:hypothetical protein
MVACHPAGRTHRLAQVRDRAAAPAADLVAKEAQPADEAAPDGARGYHSATGLVGVRRRSDLDRVAIASQLDDEGRVVEIAPWAMPARGVEGLENATVEPDGRVTTRAQRNPIEIKGCCVRRRHSRLSPSLVRRRRTSACGWRAQPAKRSCRSSASSNSPAASMSAGSATPRCRSAPRAVSSISPRAGCRSRSPPRTAARSSRSSDASSGSWAPGPTCRPPERSQTRSANNSPA